MSHGLRLTGETPDGVYVEICELADHPWYLGCQFHPEFKSKPLEPHPLFREFVGAAIEHRQRRMDGVHPGRMLEPRAEVTHEAGREPGHAPAGPTAVSQTAAGQP